MDIKKLPTHTKSGRKIRYDEYGNDIDIMNISESLCKMYLEHAKISGLFNQLVDVMEEFHNIHNSNGKKSI